MDNIPKAYRQAPSSTHKIITESTDKLFGEVSKERIALLRTNEQKDMHTF